MKKKIAKELVKWERETNELAKNFIVRYFCTGKTTLPEVDWYWIGGRIGGVLEVADYFFDMDMIVDSFRFKVGSRKLFAYYDYRLVERNVAHIPANLRSFKMSQK
jgi:hypothetical protein